MQIGQAIAHFDGVVGICKYQIVAVQSEREGPTFAFAFALQLNRKEAAHLSFGTGPHVCIGAALTYLEAQAVLSSLLRRWRDAPRLAAPPVRQINPLYRGFERLELVGSCDVSHCG
jgi:cytochrome P450